MNFNRQQLVENINNLIQQKNMKVGEVEQAIGISTGYISRLSKAGNESIPATDVVWKLARHFGVSTDSLISGDYSEGTDNLSVLRRFIMKLNVQTIDGILDWSAVSTKYVNAVLKGEEQLFFLVKETGNDRGVPRTEENFSEVNETYSFYKDRKIVSAAAPQDYAWMNGDGFKAKLPNGKWLYLFRMCVDLDTGTPAGGVETPYYEMYMTEWVTDGGFAGMSAALAGKASGHWRATPVFNTLGAGSVLEDAAKELYNIANQTAYDLKINAGVRSTIMDFLNDNVAEDSE